MLFEGKQNRQQKIVENGNKGFGYGAEILIPHRMERRGPNYSPLEIKAGMGNDYIFTYLSGGTGWVTPTQLPSL